MYILVLRFSGGRLPRVALDQVSEGGGSGRILRPEFPTRIAIHSERSAKLDLAM